MKLTILGGHGFNMRAGGVPTIPHLQMVKAMKELGIYVMRQPPNSPCFNLNDLGFFHAFKSRASGLFSTKYLEECISSTASKKNEKYYEKLLWTVSKEVLSDFPPSKLFLIALQKQVMISEGIKLEGKSINIEIHSGIRTFFGLHD